MTRAQVLSVVNSDTKETGHYQLLKDCLICNNVDEVDEWFSGIKKSIRNWQPNRKLLVLVGKQEIGKTYFFEHLLPEDLLRAYKEETNVNEDMLYERIIVNFCMRQKLLEYIQVYNFRCELPVNKRMCSYCTTWNSKWHFPQRKNVIVLNLERIDWDLYNSIDKQKLWIEIFQKF